MFEMMTIFQHTLILYAAARDLGVDDERAKSIVEQYAGMMCIPDILQYAVKGEDIVGDGYAYTHYANGCYMEYPSLDELSNFTDIHQTKFDKGNLYSAGSWTLELDLPMFWIKNPTLSKAYSSAVEVHLKNDRQVINSIIAELFYYNIVCNKIYSRVTNRVFPLRQADLLLATIRRFFDMYFLEQIKNEVPEVLDGEWLVYAENSFKNLFEPRIANLAIQNIREEYANITSDFKFRIDKKALLSKLKKMEIIRENPDICKLAWCIFVNSKANTKNFLEKFVLEK